MPISTLNLNLAILTSSIMLWLMTWFLMGTVASVVPTVQASLPPAEVVILLIGLNALTESVRLRRRTAERVAYFVAVFAVGLGLRLAWHALSPFPVWPFTAGVGLVAFAAAAILNHHTLTRSSTVYRAKPALAFPFGEPQTR